MNDPRFSVLAQKQINTLKEFGHIITFDQDTLVFDVGDNNYDFYVILEGEIQIKDPIRDEVVGTHGVHQFTGDSSMLSNRRIPFSAHAPKGTTVLCIKPEVLKEVISKHSDISDVLLSAFIQRQETMLREFIGGIKVIGSEKSKETYQLRDFMEKNHIWHTFLNTDTSEEAKALLESFGLTHDDLPILINITGEMFKKPSLGFDLWLPQCDASKLASSFFICLTGLM